MAKILSSLFIPIYLSWVVNQTLENLYWFLTLIAKRAVFWIFFYLSMPESFFCGRLHPSRGMFDYYYLCSLSCNTLPTKKKKKKQKGISQRDTLHCTQLIEKKTICNWIQTVFIFSWLKLKLKTQHYFTELVAFCKMSDASGLNMTLHQFRLV